MKMDIRNERQVTNTTFGKLNFGETFLDLEENGEDDVFLKMGHDDSDVITMDGIEIDKQWLAVNLRTGDFVVFWDDAKVTRVKTVLVIKGD